MHARTHCKQYAQSAHPENKPPCTKARAADASVPATAIEHGYSLQAATFPHPVYRGTRTDSDLPTSTHPPWTSRRLAPRTALGRQHARSQHWSQSLPFQQFQALFNSLFKVLCIFPSRYLFAIGLSPVFSFRWNLPPILSCNPKQLDSLKAHRTRRLRATDGTLTLYGRLFQATYARATADDSLYRLQLGLPQGQPDFQIELFPLHSPLLGESLLVSFPPLSYMLKFSGSSYLI